MSAVNGDAVGGSAAPRYYGFNFQWMFAAPDRPVLPSEIRIAERELDFIQEMGCNFVRLPLDYRFWTRGFRYDEGDEAMLAKVDECVRSVVGRGMHCSLNLHRAPGYCINGAEREKHNLWRDEAAQDAFVGLWEGFARRYGAIRGAALSFDLLNEPPEVGQYGLTRSIHAALMRRTAAAIRAVSADRPITLDGLGGGDLAMPELADLGVGMSTRGYQPMGLTHFGAPWCADTRGRPASKYPGIDHAGKSWDRAALLAHYAPWRELADAGVSVHVGEFGCYNQVGNDRALAWFTDLLSIYRHLGWGFALWNLDGPFGIIDHGRPGTRWETIAGFKVDRDLFELYREHMQED